jgi:hypothetical protein
MASLREEVEFVVGVMGAGAMGEMFMGGADDEDEDGE